jgi:hypothetical protein
MIVTIRNTKGGVQFQCRGLGGPIDAFNNDDAKERRAFFGFGHGPLRLREFGLPIANSNYTNCFQLLLTIIILISS